MRSTRRGEGTYEDNTVFLLVLVRRGDFSPASMHIVADRHEPPERPGKSRSVPELKRLVLWFHSRRNYLGGSRAGEAEGSIPSPSPVAEEHDEPWRAKGGKQALVNPARANGPSHPFPILIRDRKRRGEAQC